MFQFREEAWFVLFVCLAISHVQAAPILQIDPSGQLTGAKGVIVDGSLYDVSFKDGTCITLFSGCDQISDFTFSSQTSAIKASKALLDQVFVDGMYLFDTFPALTTGCTVSNQCYIYTPYSPAASRVPFGVKFLEASFALNNISTDRTGSALQGPKHGTQLSGYEVYAVWAVPEPKIAGLVFAGIGVLFLGAFPHIRRDIC